MTYEPAMLFAATRSALIKNIGYQNAAPFLGLVGFDGAQIVGSDGSRRAATTKDVLTRCQR